MPQECNMVISFSSDFFRTILHTVANTKQIKSLHLLKCQPCTDKFQDPNKCVSGLK